MCTFHRSLGSYCLAVIGALFIGIGHAIVVVIDEPAMILRRIDIESDLPHRMLARILLRSLRCQDGPFTHEQRNIVPGLRIDLVLYRLASANLRPAKIVV